MILLLLKILNGDELGDGHWCLFMKTVYFLEIFSL